MAADEAAVVLEKICRQIESSPPFSACSVTASIGAVTYPKAHLDAHALVKAADDLMYRIKSKGKNGRVVETVSSDNRLP
jgi:diguanylate cyclase (GGDEF)-like protein